MSVPTGKLHVQSDDHRRSQSIESVDLPEQIRDLPHKPSRSPSLAKKQASKDSLHGAKEARLAKNESKKGIQIQIDDSVEIFERSQDNEEQAATHNVAAQPSETKKKSQTEANVSPRAN